MTTASSQSTLLRSVKRLTIRQILLAASCLALPLLHSQMAFADEAVSADKAEAAAANATTLTGNWGGLRSTLQDKGIDLNATLIQDILSNPTGGSSRGTVLQGIVEPGADVDFGKLAGIDGLTGHATAFFVYGRGMSTSDLNNNIATSTGIEAERATRLFEAWLQKTFYDGDLSVRIGQLGADQEFAVTQYGLLFLNSAYGWPSSLAANMPGGGPGYPMASPGVRFKIGQTDPWSVLVGLFDGDPAGPAGIGTAQSRNAKGTNFPLNNGLLAMTEIDYANKGDKVDLPGTYKVGFWYNTENFADQRYGTDGLSLADPGTNGIAVTHHGNYGFYGVVDQTLWHAADNNDKAVDGFVRFLWNPDDRNIVAYQVDAGVNLTGMISSRPNDVIGLAFTYLPITSSVSGLSNDNNVLNATGTPVRDYESQIELTYQAPINNWLTIQPDFQYVFHPGGNVADPNSANGTDSVRDAAIFGIRAVVKF